MSSRKSALSRAVRPLIESLENRQMLSATLNSTSHQLSVSGDDNLSATNDTITVVRLADDNYHVTINGTASTFGKDDVTSIVIDGGDGDDTIAINTALLSNATITGGAGHNTLTLVGTTGADTESFGDGSIQLSESTVSVTQSGFDNLRFDGRGGGDWFTAGNANRVALAGSQNFAALTVNDSAVVSIETGAASLVRTKLFTLNSSSTFNVNSNSLLIDYSDYPSTQASPYAALRERLKHGLVTLGGNDVGIGLSSEFVDAPTGTTLSIVDNGAIAGGAISSLGQFGSVPVKSVIVGFTWFGDANFDGRVNGSDYALVDTGFASGDATWTHGDFNLSDVVDGADYGLTDTGFVLQSQYSIGQFNAPPASLFAMPLWDTNGVTSAVRVAWKAPNSNVQKYLVYASENGGDFTLLQDTTATHFDYVSTIEGNVQFRVAAVYNIGSATLQHLSTSMAVDAVTPGGPVIVDVFPDDNTTDPTTYTYPDLPDGVPNAPSNVAASRNYNYVHLAWTDQSGDETGFIIQRCEANDSFFTDLTTVAANTTSYNDTSALPGVWYTYRIIATNDNGDSAPSETNTAPRRLAVPTAFTATATNWQTVNLTWTDANTTQTDFRIEYWDDQGNDPQTITVPGDLRSYDVTGLAADTNYTFRIQAFQNFDSRGMVTSGWSGTPDDTTGDWGQGSPAPITNFSTEVAGSDSVNLTWDDHASGAGSESGYLITYTVTGGRGVVGTTETKTINGANDDDQGSYQLTGLDPETHYHIEMQPLDPDGNPMALGSGANSTSADFLSDPKGGANGFVGSPGTELEFAL